MKNVIAILFLLSLVVGCGESREEKATRAKTAAEAEAKAVAAAKFAEDWKVIEKAIRKQLKKPVGEITEADLEKVTTLSLTNHQLTDVPKGLEKLPKLKTLNLSRNQLTDIKELEKLTQLKELWILFNPDLTKAQFGELATALPNCFIIRK